MKIHTNLIELVSFLIVSKILKIILRKQLNITFMLQCFFIKYNL